MSLTRHVGRRYFATAIDIGATRLSRIDEEQLDRLSTNLSGESPSSVSECSSSMSTPLPPFPSPPFLPTSPPTTASIDFITTPPLPPPPADEYSPPIYSTVTKTTRSVDVDSAIYSQVDEQYRVVRTTSGSGLPQQTAKAVEVTGGDREALALRYIKEKYDSLGKVRVDRPPVKDASVTGEPFEVNKISPDFPTIVAGSDARSARYISATYDVPSSIMGSRAALTQQSTASMPVTSNCSGNCSTSSGNAVQYRHTCAPSECHSEGDRLQQHRQMTSGQLCHHQHLQQQQHRMCVGHCAHPTSQSRNNTSPSLDAGIAHGHGPSATSCQSVNVAKVDFSLPSSTVTTTTITQQQFNHQLCSQHQQKRQQLEPSPNLQSSSQNQEQHHNQQQRQSSTQVSTSSSDSTTDTNAHNNSLSIASLILEDHEQAQIDLFYRGHETFVVVCSTVARLSLSFYNPAENAVDASAVGNSRRAAAVAKNRSNTISGQHSMPPSAVDERSWTPTGVIGVPVAVLDSGSGRRQRCLSIVLAERGTGFEMWRTTVGYLSSDYFRFEFTDEQLASAVRGNVGTVDPAVAAASSQSSTVHHIIRVRDDKRTYNIDPRLGGGLPIRWARLTFDDSKAANDFVCQLEKHVADVEGGDGSKRAGGHHQQKIKEQDRQRSAGSHRKKSTSVSKTDISQPCCFSHVTRIERSEVMVTANSPQAGGSGLRGILRGGLGCAMKGLAAAVTMGTGNDESPMNG